MINIFKWRNYLSLYIVVILLFNLVLLKLPLTSVFGYEFSVVNSLLIVLLAGIYTIYFYRLEFNNNKINFVPELFKSLMVFLLVPFVVSVTNSFFTGFCSFFDGLQFYIFITFPAIVIGSSLGLLSVVYVRKYQVVLLFLLYFLILSVIAFEIYFNPQVYVFNPIIGYFPGTIYDEGISVSLKLIFYRLINVIFFGWIIVSVIRMKRLRKRNRTIFSIKMLIAVTLFIFVSPSLGFSTTKGSLTDALSKTVLSEHFVIHYDKRIETKRIKMLAINHEFYYDELKNYFHVELSEKTHSFVFYNNDQKKELFGSRNADVAKPWLNQIYISIGNWEHTLKHELAHCFSADFGAGILKLASGLNPMLIEGIAEAADGNYDDNSLHFMASLAYNYGYKVDLEILLTTFGFYSQTSSISYIYAGSFIQYLVNIYGIDKFKNYYLNGEFEKSYKRDLKNVLNEYYSFLNDSKYKFSEDEAHYYFGRKSLFYKVCPRAISEQLKRGWKQISISDFMGAQNNFEEVLVKSDNYSALMGLLQSYSKQDSIQKSIDFLNREIENFRYTSYYYNLELKLADLLVQLNNFSKADSLYKKLIEQKPNRNLYNVANIRKVLIKKDLISEYIDGSNFDKYTIISKLNRKSYNYWAFPVMIYLSENLDEDYNLFVENLDKKFTVYNYSSSYAALVLSKYMLDKYDFVNARKMAGLSLRYNSDENLKEIQKVQFNKAIWFYENAEKILNTLRLGEE